MLIVAIPEKLINRIYEFSGLFCQTPEEYIIELIEDRIEHKSAYNETAYLAKSEINRKRLNKAVEEIKSDIYEPHRLIND